MELEWKERVHLQLLYRGLEVSLVLPRAEESINTGKTWPEILAQMISDESTFHPTLNVGDLFCKQTSGSTKQLKKCSFRMGLLTVDLQSLQDPPELWNRHWLQQNGTNATGWPLLQHNKCLGFIPHYCYFHLKSFWKKAIDFPLGVFLLYCEWKHIKSFTYTFNFWF